MRIYNVSGISYNKNINFGINNKQSEKAFSSFIDITKKVGYNGPKPYTPAPLSVVGSEAKAYFDMLEVDWATHVEPGKRKSSL